MRSFQVVLGSFFFILFYNFFYFFMSKFQKISNFGFESKSKKKKKLSSLFVGLKLTRIMRFKSCYACKVFKYF